MGRFMRGVAHTGYLRCVKPILFRFHPDTVHARTIALCRRAQRWRIILVLTRWWLAYEHPILKQTLHGITFANPVGLSAGFDKSVELLPLLESIGFGFATGGSVTGRVCIGNEKPWFHRLPKEKSLVVNVGLANQGSAAVAKRLAGDTRSKRVRMPQMISVARTNDRVSSADSGAVQDYLMGLKNLRRYATMFEINISCPNTYGGEPFTDPSRLKVLLSAIDTLKLSQPVFVKMPSNKPWKEFDALLKVVAEHNIAGVTICNLRKDRKNVEIDAEVKGNLSGLPVRELSDDLIARTYKKYGKKLTIIGVGGIFTAEDAYRKIRLGANMVALVTGLIYEGPAIVGEINDGLVRLAQADGYDNIGQAVGADVQ